jgi:hypothetical protein
VQSAARDIEQSVTSAAHEVESGVRSVESQLNEAASTAPASEAATPPASAGETNKSDASATAGGAGDASRQSTLPGLERI